MTNAEIAHRLRCLMDVYGDMGELQHLANELDPPKPEPGTVKLCSRHYNPVISLGYTFLVHTVILNFVELVF